jgi:hypothetical protein
MNREVTKGRPFQKGNRIKGGGTAESSVVVLTMLRVFGTALRPCWGDGVLRASIHAFVDLFLMRCRGKMKTVMALRYEIIRQPFVISKITTFSKQLGNINQE